MVYCIVDTSEWKPLAPEELGSKRKVWLLKEPNERWLFKYSRRTPGGDLVGEHWAEKIASELAEKLGIPHAEVELAKHRGTLGVISRDFTRQEYRSELVLGNELLQMRYPAYDRSQPKPRAHTVKRVLTIIRIFPSPPNLRGVAGLARGVEAFVGYLMLDALIGNTDRHHENWGILFRQVDEGSAEFTLAPSFDHASSLGRELDDDKRSAILDGPDPRQTVEGYCARGKSPFFNEALEPSQLKVRQVWHRVLELQAPAAQIWLNRLKRLTSQDLQSCVESIPSVAMSDTAKRFAVRMLELNKKHLMNLGSVSS